MAATPPGALQLSQLPPLRPPSQPSPPSLVPPPQPQPQPTRVLAKPQQFLQLPEQHKADGAAAGFLGILTGVQPSMKEVSFEFLPCAVSKSADCTRKQQIAALWSALEALEGQPPVLPTLNAVTEQLEDALDSLDPNGIKEFRRSHLALAFNAVRPPPDEVERARAALQALEPITSWPAKGAVASALEGLRSQSQVPFPLPAPAKPPPPAFAHRIFAMVQHWLPWSSS